jgi:hypothetical protein
MKSIYKKSHVVLVVLFVIGVLYSGYILYNLPTALEKVSARIDLNAIQEAQPVFTTAYTVVGITLLLGFIVVIQFLYMLNSVGKQDVKVQNNELGKDKSELSADRKESETDSISDIAKEIKLSARELRDDRSKHEKILAKLCMKLEASQGIYYNIKREKHKRFIEMQTSFAFSLPESETLSYEFGEGLAGQVAKEGKKINISNVPDGYIKIISGLGYASPNHLLIYPVKEGENVVAVVEIASFKEISDRDEKLVAEVFKIEQSKQKAAKEDTPATDEIQNSASEDKQKKK